MKEDGSKTNGELMDELLRLRRENAELEKAQAELFFCRKEWEETFDSINDAITVHDRNFTVLRANKAARKLFQLPPEGLSGQKCYQLFHCSDAPPEDCPCYRLFKTGVASAVEKFEPRLGRHIEIKVFPLVDQIGEILRVAHVVRDITDRKQMEFKLKESEDKYRSVVETTDDSIYIVDRDCRYIFINIKHLSRLGISDDSYIGKTYGEYHTAEETRWFTESIQKVIDLGKAYHYEHTSKRDDNHFLLTLSPIRSGDGEISAVSIISKNITEFKRMQDKLRILSITDDLTGLYNRRGFFSLSEHQLKLAARMKKGLFLFYADIDNLKQVNDKFGHIEGDQVVIKTAEILRESFRTSDIIARIGGDEFVIFPVEAEEGAVDAILGRLETGIRKINLEMNQKYSISLSIGKAYYDPSKPCSIEELLNQADIAMYEGKSGKNKSI